MARIDYSDSWEIHHVTDVEPSAFEQLEQALRDLGAAYWREVERVALPIVEWLSKRLG